MTEERRLEILKLVAIFRLANALDKSKRRKLHISKIRITNEKLEIKATASGSALLEKWAFEECAGLFKEVFGLSPELQIRSEPVEITKGRKPCLIKRNTIITAS